MPGNTQIDKVLSYLRDAEPVDVHKLSQDGKTLIQDSRDIIETARRIVKHKNADELFQNFVWHTRDIDTTSTEAAHGEGSDVDRGRLTEDGRVGARIYASLSNFRVSFIRIQSCSTSSYLAIAYPHELGGSETSLRLLCNRA